MTYIFCNSNIEFISATPSAPSGINGGDGGGGGANDDPNEIVIDPNLFNLDLNKINLFLTNLRTTDLAAYNYFNSHSEIKNQVMSYLFANYFSEESTIFANQIIIKMKQNPTLYTSIKPFLIEKNIDDSQLDPCSKGVFQQVKNTTNCDFANVLAKLGANNTVYNTTMITAHNSVVVHGQLKEVDAPANTIRTTQSVKYDYTMYINPDYPGKTKLFIAALLLHEVVHAYFFSLVDDYNAGATNSFNELPVLFQKFVDKTYPGSSDMAHHEEIANSYVAAIASALQEYQPGLPDQIYSDLAWAGLNNTQIFNVKFPVGNPNRQRILNRGACEQTGQPVGQGTSNQQNPTGQPCN
jgi:hypothetical protein